MMAIVVFLLLGIAFGWTVAFVVAGIYLLLVLANA